MKTFVHFAALMVFPAFLSFGQSTQALEVKGQGEVTTQPDLGVLHVQLEVRQMDFGKTVSALNKAYEEIQRQLNKLGFKESDIKTRHYSVHQHTIYNQGRSYDSGFVGQQQLAVEFPNKKERIGEITNSFTKSKGDARFSYSFILSKEKRNEVTQEAMRNAMQDARQKGSLLAETSGLKLGQVKTIRYGVAEGMPVPMYKEMSVSAAGMRQADGASAGFEVDEITIQEEVVVVYELTR